MKHVAVVILVSVFAVGCLSTGGLDPNAGQRILNDLACVSAVAGAFAEAKGAMPADVTTGDVINVIKGATGSGTAATVLNACSLMLVSAGQDVGALQTLIKSKATTEKRPVPKFAPIPNSKS